MFLLRETKEIKCEGKMKERANKERCMEKERVLEKTRTNRMGAPQKGEEESKVGSRDELRILQEPLRDEAASVTAGQ
jgi:hypothetical protein